MLNIGEIRAVTEKTTPGPWNRNGDELGHDGWMAEFVRDEDAEFCAASRQWVPALCDEVEAGRAALIKKEEQNLSLQNIHDMDKGRIDDLKKQVQAALGTANMWTDAEGKQRAKNAVLKRALEMSIRETSAALDGLASHGNIKITKMVTDEEQMQHYIERAREEMEK